MNPVCKTFLTAGCWALLGAAWAWSRPGAAADSGSIAARLPAGFEIALNGIVLPEPGAAGAFDLYCVTDVTRSGRPYHNNCIADPDHDAPELRKAVDRLMRKSRLSPAVLDGKPIATELYYRVHIDAGGTAPHIEVYPNWGHSSHEHGSTYDAPQRYEPRRFPPECLFFSGVATTVVDASGRATSEPEVSTRFAADEPTLDCIGKIKARLAEGRFIAAHRDGAPVVAIYAELWGNPDNVTLGEVLDSLADLDTGRPARQQDERREQAD